MNYDESTYKIWTWKSPFMLHWILNPGLAFNEVILGQRVPKVMLVEKDNSKSLIERIVVPCPHCGTLHSSLKWNTENNTAFKNWFGLYCDACGKIIPCLTNLTSYLILGITFPLWFWFKDRWKANWLAKQPKRFKNLDLITIPNPYAGNGWIRHGLGWGVFMFIFMSFIYPYISGEEISWKSIFIAIPIWTIGGLGFGYMMKLVYRKKMNKPQIDN